jgi:hypothetical protein
MKKMIKLPLNEADATAISAKISRSVAAPKAFALHFFVASGIERRS